MPQKADWDIWVNSDCEDAVSVFAACGIGELLSYMVVLRYVLAQFCTRFICFMSSLVEGQHNTALYSGAMISGPERAP